MINPTATQLLARPELLGATLTFSGTWTWISPTGIFECDGDSAAEALLDRVIALEAQVQELNDQFLNVTGLSGFDFSSLGHALTSVYLSDETVVANRV